MAQLLRVTLVSREKGLDYSGSIEDYRRCRPLDRNRKLNVAPPPLVFCCGDGDEGWDDLQNEKLE